jgi:hypothetical protein
MNTLPDTPQLRLPKRTQYTLTRILCTRVGSVLSGINRFIHRDRTIPVPNGLTELIDNYLAPSLDELYTLPAYVGYTQDILLGTPKSLIESFDLSRDFYAIYTDRTTSFYKRALSSVQSYSRCSFLGCNKCRIILDLLEPTLCITHCQCTAYKYGFHDIPGIRHYILEIHLALDRHFNSVNVLPSQIIEKAKLIMGYPSRSASPRDYPHNRCASLIRDYPLRDASPCISLEQAVFILSHTQFVTPDVYKPIHSFTAYCEYLTLTEDVEDAFLHLSNSIHLNILMVIIITTVA